MRISHKIAASSGLFVLLLAGVLLYQLSLVRKLVAIHRDSSSINFPVAILALELNPLVEELEEAVRKYALTRDVDYAAKWAELDWQLEARIAELGSLELEPPEDRAAAMVIQGWATFRAGAHWLDLQVQPPTQVWIGGHESAGADACAAEGAAARLSERLAPLRALGGHSRNLLAATRQSITQRLELSGAESREASRVAGNVVGVALMLILAVSVWTARSINAPLRRFVAGTRAVADGKFFVQLDESTGDEFAYPAASFNTMVRRLGELEQLKKDFLAHVSHELKTPLVAMQETNALLLEQLAGPLNDRQRRVVSLNLESARRLSAMISSLLDLSRLEAGALEYDFKEHDLVEIVELVVAELEGRLKEKGLWLEADFSHRPLRLRCDRDRLIQVVENLYENAIKFSRAAGTVGLAVATSEAPPAHLPAHWRRRFAGRALGNCALLSVSDSGPGVLPEKREKIFEKFHQVEKTRGGGAGGVGLGLAICGEIVAAHAGAIWVSDNPDGGSVFHLLLPLDPRRVAVSESARAEVTA
ncbi:MAG: HAMP domain-containing protein [bacterium]|nr:HAMP domain-containing protein [bacterium]